MKENPALVAVGSAHAGDPRGTPAGNAEFTQEQFDVLRSMRFTRESFEVRSIMIATRPPYPGAIPDQYRAQAEMVEMPCPVLGYKLVDIGVWTPILLLPDGREGYPLK